MKALLKKVVPLPVRVEIKKLGHAWLDWRNPVAGKRVPSRRETFIGGGDFVAVGDGFFKTLKRHGLRPENNVLDIGCGQGRMARPMVDFLTGDYLGMDINSAGIVWCQAQYAEVPNFQFQHMDAYNSRYNKAGTQAAEDYIFPVENDRFDMVYLTSVFTHMLAKEVENYLCEISRSLKQGGQVLATWYLLDETSQAAERPHIDFAYEFDAVSRTSVKSTPEAAIAFDINFVKSLYEKAGLEIVTIEFGHWARPDSPYMLQDLIVARKA